MNLFEKQIHLNFMQNEYNNIQKARKPKRNGGCPYEETRSHRSRIGSRCC